MISRLENKEDIEQDDFPPFLICQISAEVMVDPVVELSGNSGERTNMTEAIAMYRRCVFNKNPMRPEQLIPNTALKHAIHDYKDSKRENLSSHYLAIGIKKIEELTLYLRQIEKHIRSSAGSPKIFPTTPGITDWPFAMVCPLRLQWMTDPYITPYGNSYEKSAIEDWLISQIRATDPLVNKPLTRQQLIQNINLENSIVLFKAEFKGQPDGELKEKLNQIKNLFATISQKITEIEAAIEKDKQAKIARLKRILMTLNLIMLGYYLFLIMSIAKEYHDMPEYNSDDSPTEDTADNNSWFLGKNELKKYLLSAFAIIAANPDNFLDTFYQDQDYHFQIPSSHLTKAIDFAIKHRRIDLVQSLFKTISAAHFTDYVMFAITREDIDALKMLDHANQAILRLSPDLLFFAIRRRKYKLMEFLLKRGISANSESLIFTHSIPIHFAADEGDCNAIKLLLRYNADVNQPNSIGRTPLETALRSNRPDAVDLLIKTDPNSADKLLKNNSVILYFDIANTVDDTRLDFFSWLLTSDHVSLPDLKTEWLLTAIERRQPKIIELLLSHGLDIPTLFLGLSHATYHSIYGSPELFDSTQKIFKLLLKLVLQALETTPNPHHHMLFKTNRFKTFPDYRSIVSTTNISLDEHIFEKQFIITSALLINAGTNIALQFQHIITEALLLKIIDEIEKTSANLEEPRLQARGLKSLFDYALKKGYATIVERLTEKVRPKELAPRTLQHKQPYIKAPTVRIYHRNRFLAATPPIPPAPSNRVWQPKACVNSSKTSHTVAETANPQMHTSAAGPKYDATIPNLIKQGLNFIPLAYTAASAGGRWLLSHLSSVPAKPRISVRNIPIDETVPSGSIQNTIPEPTMAPTAQPSKRNFALTKTPELTSFIDVLVVLDFIVRWKKIRPMKLASGVFSFFTSRSLSLDDDYQLTQVFPEKMRQIMDTVHKLEPSSEMLLRVNDNGLEAAKKLLTDISKSIYQALKTEKVTPSTLEDIENKFVTIDKALARCAKTIKTVKKASRLSKNGKSHELYWENGSLFARRISKKAEKSQTVIYLSNCEYQVSLRHPGMC